MARPPRRFTPLFARPADPETAALETTVNQASRQASILWVAYLSLWAYLFFTTIAVTDRDLILESPIQLPLIGVKLGLVAFFWAGPPLIWVFHLYLLRKALFLRTAIERAAKRIPPAVLRQRLDAFVLTRMIAGVDQGRLMPTLNGIIGVVTMVILPVVVLAAFQIRFLAYHSEEATWWQRGFLCAGLVTAWFAMRVLTGGRAVSPGVRRRVAGVIEIHFVAAFVASFSLATFPQERIAPEKWVTGWEADDWWPAFIHRVLNPKDRDFADDPALDKRQWGIDLRDRHLEDADLTGAILRKARLDRARLQGARLEEARLQGASLERAQLQGASLYGAQFQGASLVRAQLQGASLVEAHFQGAYLSRARLWRANIATIEPATIKDFDETDGGGFDLIDDDGKLIYSSSWRTYMQLIYLDEYSRREIAEAMEMDVAKLIKDYIVRIPEGWRRVDAVKRLENLTNTERDKKNEVIFDSLYKYGLKDRRLKRSAYLGDMVCKLRGGAEEATHSLWGRISLFYADRAYADPARFAETILKAKSCAGVSDELRAEMCAWIGGSDAETHEGVSPDTLASARAACAALPQPRRAG